jgi:hypothetical protein
VALVEVWVWGEVMKRPRYCLIFSIMVLIFTSGCQPDKEIESLVEKSKNGQLESVYKNQETQVVMETEKTIYPLSEGEITLKIKNLGSTHLYFGSPYQLEKYKEGSWYKVPFEKDTAFNDIGYSLGFQETNEQEILLKLLDYQMTEGLYRLVKDFNTDIQKIKLGVEFSIDKMAKDETEGEYEGWKYSPFSFIVGGLIVFTLITFLIFMVEKKVHK